MNQNELFRQKYPDGKLQTSVVRCEGDYIFIEVRVFAEKSDSADSFIANAICACLLSDVGENFVDTVESALKHALVNAGIEAQNDNSDKATNPENTGVQEVAPVAEPLPYAPPPAKTDDTPFIPEPPAQTYTMITPVTDIVNMMSVDDAKRVVVDCGVFKGRTLAEVAMEKPSSLTWYINAYSGPNNILRAGAKKLLDAAQAA